APSPGEGAGGGRAAAQPSHDGSGQGSTAATSAGQGAGGGHAAGHRPDHGSGRPHRGAAAPGQLAAIPGAATAPAKPASEAAHQTSADPAIPGLVPEPRSGSAALAAKAAPDTRATPGAKAAPAGKAAHGGKAATAGQAARAADGGAAIPGLHMTSALAPQDPVTAYRRHHPSPVRKPVSETRAQQEFISAVAPGAVAAQHRYGVPAAVTIAQAIDESGWGQSQLAAQDHNLFGIKGTGPAGTVPLPTQEYVNGQPVSTSASFRVYHNVAESIDDHGRLLARSGYYQQAMGDQGNPDKFAAALTGVYATDPNYGATLITLMRRYALYQYGAAGQGQARKSPGAGASGAGSATIPGVPGAVPAPGGPAGSAATPSAAPRPTRSASPGPTSTASPQPPATGSPSPSGTSSAQPTPTPSPSPSGTVSAGPTPTAQPNPSGTTSRQPAATGSQRPPEPGSPEPTGPDSPTPARTSSPPPTSTSRPRPTSRVPAKPSSPASAAPSSRVPAKPSSRASARPAAPSLSPSIPGIDVASTQSESESPMTSAIHFGPAAPFVPVTRSAPVTARSTPGNRSAQVTASSAPARARSAPRARSAAAVRFGPAARFVPVARSAPVRATLLSTHRYQPQIPRSVLNSFVESAKAPLLAEETTYRDVASFRGISWQLLAACDWMQCEARSRRSPVYGERLGTVNADGTVYTQRSAALARCADDLVGLARTVYGIDLTRGRDLSVRDLANAFAAFRWGGLLKAQDCSAMEFPYSVAGLTGHHLGMRWPRIAAPGTGDRPGSRFRRTFGAVPIVLGLDYPATV
ncbi:MAG: hypothetical protein QOG05_4959, partial [Streptosporangiaceae bacterium]|nr:hypothetical protein [Streptosporangiaceae bacterium]